MYEKHISGRPKSCELGSRIISDAVGVSAWVKSSWQRFGSYSASSFFFSSPSSPWPYMVVGSFAQFHPYIWIKCRICIHSLVSCLRQVDRGIQHSPDQTTADLKVQLGQGHVVSWLNRGNTPVLLLTSVYQALHSAMTCWKRIDILKTVHRVNFFFSFCSFPETVTKSYLKLLWHNPLWLRGCRRNANVREHWANVCSKDYLATLVDSIVSRYWRMPTDCENIDVYMYISV